MSELEITKPEGQSEGQSESESAPASALLEWRVPIALFALTLWSTTWIGQQMVTGEANPTPALWEGWVFSVPLMAILLAHEMGHYVAGRMHRVEISPPYFIPAPVFLLGTLGAVIRMRGAIKSRNALLDIGAAGPLAGMVIAVPVLAIGILQSAITPLPETMPETMFFEGHNLLYDFMLLVLRGGIPEGQDIMLSPTAFAGWAGLLVTQINLIPIAQLDGGHVAYALFGERQNRYSRIAHAVLPLVGIGVSAWYVWQAWSAGERGAELHGEAMAGAQWIFWAIVLGVLVRLSGADHPPTNDEPLTPMRRMIAAGTLLLFVLLFMPSWVYVPNMQLW
ncbi:MAG: site-2 protease family protein [Sandaracinaceae bacterium]|nr:site-2 protease family protein [Myxococcales bacterium]